MEQMVDLGHEDSSLQRYLEGEWWHLKKELSRLLGSPLFWPRYGLSLDEIRALTTERVMFFLRTPVMKRFFLDLEEQRKNFISRSLVIAEFLAMVDLATSVKGCAPPGRYELESWKYVRPECGVNCFLFCGAVRSLGSPGHVTKWLHPFQELKHTGMFAMTERGHGSNVKGIQTKATFDLAAQEFVIDTPCENAQKMYIGNAMCGNYAAVFAQLIINGSSQGPHCFIVPIRNENGDLCPGVTAIDMMHKQGLNGVDNGILIFNKVRIPRENLLDKFGSVAPDGQYHSPIENKDARFSLMLALMAPSRLAIVCQVVGTMKFYEHVLNAFLLALWVVLRGDRDDPEQLGLSIAIRYSYSRRQFGPKGKEEVKIIDFQTHTFRLMPHLATALALTFTNRYVGSLLEVVHGKDVVDIGSLQALVAGLKAYSTWKNVSCLQDCRECTGGMGYMMENQISGLKCDTDVFTTFEGDNVIMLQVVARELLSQYNKQYKKNPLFSLLKNWAASASDKLRTSFLAFNVDMISNLTFLLKAVHFRERVLQRSLMARIYYKMVTKKEDSFSAWNSCLHHIVSLSLAHIQRVSLEQFSLAVRHCPDPQDQALLMKFCLLYGTNLVFQERAWYLEHKYLSLEASKETRSQLLDLCESVKDDALKVISAFNIPRTSIHAPIARIPNPRAPWAFSAAPEQPLTAEGAGSPRPKL